MICGELINSATGDVYRNAAGLPCGSTIRAGSSTPCAHHVPNPTIYSVGGKASIRARLRQKRTPLRTNEQRMVALERAVASLDDGESSIKRSAAIICAVQVAHRIWSDTELEQRIKTLEAAK